MKLLKAEEKPFLCFSAQTPVDTAGVALGRGTGSVDFRSKSLAPAQANQFFLTPWPLNWCELVCEG